MYIKKVIIKNIRSISHFEMEFPKPAGWHVLIGDNGAGKSTVVKSIAIDLIGPDQFGALRQSPEVWLNRKSNSGSSILNIERDEAYDGESGSDIDFLKLTAQANFLRGKNLQLSSEGVTIETIPEEVLAFLTLGNEGEPGKEYKKWGEKGWFSCGFGPFRRFSGGNQENEKLFKSHPRVGAHLSLFGEDVSLVEALEWIKELDYARLKEKEKNNGKENTYTFINLLKFINESQLLPHSAQIEEVDERGVVLTDGNQNRISALELSDGYRSILSLTFELIRQLVRVYGAKQVFADIEKGSMQISLPGVVLIDEIDAHLHPSWQTRIGQWFTNYFPKIQFIVTTHSPLVCRACDKGSIWRLAAPGSGEVSGEVTGTDREKLISGNILDAYGTEVFGSSPVRSEKSNEKLKRLGRLNMLSALGKITAEEEKERLNLQQILSTDAPTGQ